MKSIKTLLGVVFMAALSLQVSAQELPKPSPSASFKQTVGVTNISMKYSRPSVKGRTIWGDLVAYDKVWRAGANSSTKINFSTDVIINGKEVPAGKYALFVIPSANEWTFIISSHITGNGTSGYTEDSDIVRVTAKPMASNMTESLLYSVDNLTDNSCTISLSWEKVTAGFDVKINTKEFAKVVVEKTVAEADKSFRSYNNAAKWYLDNGDAAKAVEMGEKSVSQTKKFWNVTVLSEAYFAAGDVKMAIKTAQEAVELSEKADYQPYVKKNKANIEAWKAKK
ncbi:MAG: DUF2911 domain-containing protein [Salibacteraceae bacterium]